jgi:hypothetical protein
LEEWYDDMHLETGSDNTSSLLQRDVGPSYPSDMSPRDISELEKRNPIAILFSILAQFGTRIAVQVAVRATASVAANSPRLAGLLRNPDRLFQIAARGKGTRAGQKGMQSAKDAIKKDYKRWVKCLKDGKPLI